MRAFELLIRPENTNRQIRRFTHQATIVISIGNTDLALTRADGFEQFGVIGEYLGCQIRHPAFHDRFGFRLAVFTHHHGN